MNPIYFLLIIPLLAPFLVLYFTKRFTKENLIPASAFMAGGTLILALIIAAISNYTTRDTEVLNGFVLGKEIHRFECPTNTSNPCENGYDCNCVTTTYDCGTKESPQTCSTTDCDTCYEYDWERNFFVHSSLQGERAYKISRIDDQGAKIPPRWTSVREGDPVSITNVYKNYILGVADSLFSEDGVAEEKYRAIIPAYPLNVYDYYRIDRLVTVGKVKLDQKVWNESISRILVQVGPKKQANVIVVVAEGVGMDFANAVRRSWKGFKQNDIVVFAGVDAAGNLTWTRTMSWSKLSMVNIKMESEILGLFKGKPLEPLVFTDTIKTVSLAHFERRSMEEFKYLKDSAPLSTTQITLIMIISTLLGAGLTIGQLHLLNSLPAFMTGRGRPGLGRYYGGSSNARSSQLLDNLRNAKLKSRR